MVSTSSVGYATGWCQGRVRPPSPCCCFVLSMFDHPVHYLHAPFLRIDDDATALYLRIQLVLSWTFSTRLSGHVARIPVIRQRDAPSQAHHSFLDLLHQIPKDSRALGAPDGRSGLSPSKVCHQTCSILMPKIRKDS